MPLAPLRCYNIFFDCDIHSRILGVAPSLQQWPPGLLHFLIGNPYNPSFTTVTVRGPYPSRILFPQLLSTSAPSWHATKPPRSVMTSSTTGLSPTVAKSSQGWRSEALDHQGETQKENLSIKEAWTSFTVSFSVLVVVDGQGIALTPCQFALDMARISSSTFKIPVTNSWESKGIHPHYLPPPRIYPAFFPGLLRVHIPPPEINIIKNRCSR